MGTNNKKYLFKPRRTLGRTGFMATQLGIGDLADRNVSIDECVTTVRRALDVGLNVIDTAPGYEDGYSEEIVGRALKGSRDNIFVIDKIDHHDRPIAGQVEDSLRRLDMDTVDLFVMHGLSTKAGWEQAVKPSGAFDQLENCRKNGKLRYLGISSHDPRVLELAIESGLCDVVMFAVGPYCDRRYIDKVLPLAGSHNVGTVCFKTFGAGKLLSDTVGYGKPLTERPRGKLSSGGKDETLEKVLPHLSVADCLYYTLTCDPDVTLLGLSFPNEQDAAFAAAANFATLSEEKMKEICCRAVEAMTGKGESWWNPADRSTGN
jgi:aryl-alcohol dehydrogenase-like predicted oxidoreductase